MQEYCIGIDFGTTQSSVSYCNIRTMEIKQMKWDQLPTLPSSFTFSQTKNKQDE